MLNYTDKLSEGDTLSSFGKPISSRWQLLCSVCLLLQVMSIEVAHAREYFRYQNAQGMMVIDSILPPKYASKGYSVINEKGMLVREVAPELTAAQRKVRARELVLEAKREEQLRLDEQLLKRYSSIVDIEASESRVVDEIMIRVSILRGNLRSLKSQIERQQELAANSERAGRKVPKRLIDNIATMEAEVDDTRKNISARKNEIISVTQGFSEQKKRFKELQVLYYGLR